MESFVSKFTGLQPATLFEKRLWYRCFPWNFVKFLISFKYQKQLFVGVLQVGVLKILAKFIGKHH